MAELMTFTVGQKVIAVADRKLPDDSKNGREFTISEIKDHGRVIPGVSHRYSLKMTDGNWYSGWWFDPNAESVWDDGDQMDDYPS